MESQSEGEILMRNMAAAASIIHLMQVKKKGKKKVCFWKLLLQRLHLGILNFLQNMKLNLNDLHIKIRH